MSEPNPNISFVLIAAVLAGAQWLISPMLARGQFGPVPAVAVFLPFFAWVIITLAAIVYAVIQTVRGTRRLHLGYLTILVSALGLWRSYSAVNSFLQVA